MLPAHLHVLPLLRIRQMGSPRDRLGVWWCVSRGTGVIAPPLYPFAATHIAALHARVLIGLRLAHLPPRLITEMGRGVRHLLLLGGRSQGANRVAQSPLRPLLLSWIGRVDIRVFAELCELA